MSMLFRWIHTQPGMQKFGISCCHYQYNIYMTEYYHHKPSFLWFILTLQYNGEMSAVNAVINLYIFNSLKPTSGFRPMHSTNTVLMKFVSQWSLNIENKELTGVAFVDLRKAFDTVTVDHELLISKLIRSGCSEESVKWFKSYLSDREQINNFKGKKSHSLIIKMGVPQGSILGPLLFSIYVNSMPNCMSNNNSYDL